MTITHSTYPLLKLIFAQSISYCDWRMPVFASITTHERSAAPPADARLAADGFAPPRRSLSAARLDAGAPLPVGDVEPTFGSHASIR